MNYPVQTEYLKGLFDLQKDLPDGVLGHNAVVVLGKMLLQVGVLTVLEDQIKMTGRLFEIEQLDDVFVADETEDFDLHLHTLVVFLAHVAQRYDLNGHLPHRIFDFAFVHGRKRTLAYRLEQ